MTTKYKPVPVMDDGTVKVNNGNGIVAGWAFGDVESINNQWQSVKYVAPLGLSAYPTTSWPKNIPTPTDADIYDFTNNTFVENTVLGQSHIWRVQFNYNKGQNINVRVFCQLRNTLSGFATETFTTAPGAILTAQFNFEFITIADGASLPAPLGTGQGYEIRVMADDNAFQNAAGDFLNVTSVTRISTHFAMR